MCLAGRLLILGLFVVSAIPVARAQLGPSVPLVANKGSISVYGLTFSIGACTLQLDGGATNDCATGAPGSRGNLELVAVPEGQGYIGLEVIGYSGAVGGSTSAALSETVGGPKDVSSILKFTLTAALTGNFPGTYNVIDALFTTTGSRDVGPTGGSATSSAVINPSQGKTLTLTDTLARQTGQQTVASGGGTPASFSQATNSFTVAETLTLSQNGGQMLNRLQFDNTVLRLHTAPEPASIVLLLFGLGGLAVARCRRLF